MLTEAENHLRTRSSAPQRWPQRVPSLNFGKPRLNFNTKQLVDVLKNILFFVTQNANC